LLSYESRCRGIDFTFSVTAVVLPSRSWVKPRVLSTPAESARILQHEQTHFNLTEVYARRMRRFFRELYNPCGLIDERLKESVERFVQEEADAQRRYDDETGYGLKPQVQERWDRDIATMLKELAAFAK
jgi:predicted secreted Zn-dependent protease